MKKNRKRRSRSPARSQQHHPDRLNELTRARRSASRGVIRWYMVAWIVGLTTSVGMFVLTYVWGRRSETDTLEMLQVRCSIIIAFGIGATSVSLLSFDKLLLVRQHMFAEVQDEERVTRDAVRDQSAS